MRVSVWESTDRQGMFNGFSLKLSEDTRQGNGYQAQGGYGQPNGYGQGSGYAQQANGYAPQGGYAPQNYTAPPLGHSQSGPMQPLPPVSAYQQGDEGYVLGFDD
jgi:hypothetical protein